MCHADCQDLLDTLCRAHCNDSDDGGNLYFVALQQHDAAAAHVPDSAIIANLQLQSTGRSHLPSLSMCMADPVMPSADASGGGSWREWRSGVRDFGGAVAILCSPEASPQSNGGKSSTCSGFSVHHLTHICNAGLPHSNRT
jgi:hypothetical protein